MQEGAIEYLKRQIERSLVDRFGFSARNVLSKEPRPSGRGILADLREMERQAE